MGATFTWRNARSLLSILTLVFLLEILASPIPMSARIDSAFLARGHEAASSGECRQEPETPFVSGFECAYDDAGDLQMRAVAEMEGRLVAYCAVFRDGYHSYGMMFRVEPTPCGGLKRLHGPAGLVYPPAP